MKIKEASKSVKGYAKNSLRFFAFLRRAVLSILLILMIPAFTGAEALYSPTWGFSLDLPEGYEFSGGDGENRFSFASSIGAHFDVAVYDSQKYSSVQESAESVKRQLRSSGDITYFDYNGKEAALLELLINDPQNPLVGWCFVGELSGQKAYLTALAYAPANIENVQSFHFSAIDSIVLSNADRYAPGPISEFSYPRGAPQETTLAGGTFKAIIHEGDAEAAQDLVDREFTVLSAYIDSPLWQEAWMRFYRAIYRDSYERLSDVAFNVERSLFLEDQQITDQSELSDEHDDTDEKRLFAEKALEWVQSFRYERDLMGSDFVNLVSAAVEGRGDCDSRALLWALLLQRNNIPAAIMVSKDYSHAMGLADLEGIGARFDLQETTWVVAETTAMVPLGLIGESVSDPQYWLGVILGP
ncbi:MAG: hypothetical protein LBV20_07220 [Treponema sp.]|jgi:hypothetical protein|nr:hypothetical protein [Treponema sp.]